MLGALDSMSRFSSAIGASSRELKNIILSFYGLYPLSCSYICTMVSPLEDVHWTNFPLLLNYSAAHPLAIPTACSYCSRLFALISSSGGVVVK